MRLAAFSLSFYLSVACKTPCEAKGYARGGGWVVKIKYSEDTKYNDLSTAVRLDGS